MGVPLIANKDGEIKQTLFNKEKNKNRTFQRTLLIILSLIGIVVGMLASIMVGAADIDVRTVVQSIVSYDETNVKHYTVMELRLPRAVMAFFIGACFAVAGAIMQGVTRNPLASPGLMGVSAGAGFGVIIAFAFFPDFKYHQLILVSLVGSAFGTMIVYSVGTAASFQSRGRYAHVKFALAGAAVGGLLSSLSKGIEIYYGVMTNVMYWYAAGVAGVKWFEVKTILPWSIAGLLLAMVIARQLTLLSLGDEVAAGLGQKIKWIKAIAALSVFILVGAAVSVSGPIGFIGLVIPHMTRFLIGVDYRWVIPCSALLGGLLLVVADMASRMVNPPFETPVGVLTAMIGVPFFIYLARGNKKVGL
ncbi:FecCD family ABC transporter permease [Desulfuribacillus alkaliarsenatis]|uniref:Ferrichrome ABC transporter permease n=1 Tax=Desulfuribacillus alkaliarsenatis TaxID=766136 RepID=A0A1E5G4M6_9FIRM|nr:iron ABC transporter permease [Desulfuribacillus alkaliarsenatis]OEF98126.1 ferrichrome ABC transporter permease [Desulfuribacillus alkaliarsenatis]